MNSTCQILSFFIGISEICYMSSPVGDCQYCCQRNDQLDIQYKLYTRTNPMTPQAVPSDVNPGLLSATAFDSRNPTVIYLFGFSESSAGKSTMTLKDAYLSAGDYNFIGVDWSRLIAFPWYVSAVSNSSYMGKRLADFIFALQRVGIPASTVHVIGFSLGAEAAGFAGKELRRRGVTLGRITASGIMVLWQPSVTWLLFPLAFGLMAFTLLFPHLLGGKFENFFTPFYFFADPKAAGRMSGHGLYNFIVQCHLLVRLCRSWLTGVAVVEMSGLDPAYPGYSLKNSEGHLAKGDAAFVDVIHSNPGVLGFPQAIGDVDFYPNPGSWIQPGCWVDQLVRNKELRYIYGCSHSRAWRLYAESVQNPHGFPATTCQDWTSATSRCRFQVRGYMGPAASPTLSGKLYLKTNEKSPFARNGP